MATVLTPAEIKQKITDWITTNGQGDITGAHLNTILAAIMDYVGVGYAFMGEAPASAPLPDVPVAYLAGPGTYTGYDSSTVVVPDGSLGVFFFDGSDWVHSLVKITEPGKKCFINITEDIIAWSKGFINTSGEIVNYGTDDNWQLSEPIRVTPGEVIDLSIYGVSVVNVISFYQSESTSSYVSGIVGTGSVLSQKITIPNGGNFVRFCCHQVTNISSLKINAMSWGYGSEYDSILTKKLIPINPFVGYNKFYPSYSFSNVGWIDNRFSPPEIHATDGYNYSSAIQVKRGDRITITLNNATCITSLMSLLCRVDSDGNPIYSVINGDGESLKYIAEIDFYGYVVISHGMNQINDGHTITIERCFETLIQEDSPYFGKVWHCFGTSISNINSEGKYPKYLAALSGMNQVNFGVSGGCIAASASGSKYILNAIKGDDDIADADIITIEGFVNDWSQNVPLGVLTDNSADVSFMGALNEAITYIQANSNAQIFFITDTTGREYGGTNVSRDVVRGQGLTQNDYIDATIKVCNYRNIPVIDAGRKSMISQDTADLYIIDQIHHTELGGYQYAKTIWDEMKNYHIRCLEIQ